MNESWGVRNLEACIERVKYPNKVPRRSFLMEGEFPIISQEQEFINGYWSGEKDVFRLTKPVVVFGDHTKALKYVDFDFVLGADGVKVLQPRDFIDPKYLFYFLSAFPLKALGYARHYRILKQLNVRFPTSLSEQKRIVAILDEAFEWIAAAVANAEKNLVNARELFESYLNSVFAQTGEGWVESALSDLVEIKHGFAFKSQYFKNAGEYVLLTPGNFYEEGGYRDRGDKQKFYVGEVPAGYILKKGDFLIAMTEQAAGLLGSSIIVPEGNRFLHNQRLGLVIVKPTACWCNEFFFHAFNTKRFRKAVHDDASGVKVRHTSPQKLGRVLISYPPSISVQKGIAANLDDVLLESKRLEIIYQNKLDNLAVLKQSILQKAFADELTTQPEQALREALA